MTPRIPPSREVQIQEAMDHQRSCGCRVCRVSLVVNEALQDTSATPGQLARLAIALQETADVLINEAARRIVREAGGG